MTNKGEYWIRQGDVHLYFFLLHNLGWGAVHLYSFHPQDSLPLSEVSPVCGMWFVGVGGDGFDSCRCGTMVCRCIGGGGGRGVVILFNSGLSSKGGW